VDSHLPATPATTPAQEQKASLSVLSYTPKQLRQQHVVNIDTKTLLKIEEVKLYLEGKGRSERTRDKFEKDMKQLAQRANLDVPQDVELAIARYKLLDKKTFQPTNQPATNAYKQKLCSVYHHYCKYYKIPWQLPRYTPEPASIQPPNTEKCLLLVATARAELSLKIDISVQTGLRPIEVQGYKGLKVKDIHFDECTITSRNTKGCNPRPPIHITQRLLMKLGTYITEHNLQINDLLFKGDGQRYSEHFRRFKCRLAKKLNDPSIKAIRLYDLRHAYVTKQLRLTQNCEIVRQRVGHKNLNTTQKYMHLLAGASGDWIIASTKDQKKADELLNDDFQYVLTTPDGYMKFRKPR